MFKKIKNYLFQSRAKQHLSTTEREHQFVSYAKAKTVFILFESDYTEKNPKIRDIISMLQADGKKVSAWGFIDKKEISSSILPEFRVLHHKQTDFFERPTFSFLNELAHMEFDLFIDLTLQPVLPLRYFALYVNAHFKVGTRIENAPIYDFILDIESTKPKLEEAEKEFDELYLFEQIIFYLKKIQTKD